MVVRSIISKKWSKISDCEVPYLSAIGARIYLENCTRSDISFANNLFARSSSFPTRGHCNEIKHVFRYLQGTIYLWLFYPKNMKCQMIGFADACYFSAPHKDCWQTGYIFTIGSTTISWCSQKRNTTFSQSEAPPDLGVFRSVTFMVTSSNHAEIIVLHKESP